MTTFTTQCGFFFLFCFFFIMLPSGLKTSRLHSKLSNCAVFSVTLLIRFCFRVFFQRSTEGSSPEDGEGKSRIQMSLLSHQCSVWK